MFLHKSHGNWIVVYRVNLRIVKNQHCGLLSGIHFMFLS